MRKVKKKKASLYKIRKNPQQIIFVIYIKCLDIRLISFRVTYHPT